MSEELELVPPANTTYAGLVDNFIGIYERRIPRAAGAYNASTIEGGRNGWAGGSCGEAIALARAGWGEGTAMLRQLDAAPAGIEAAPTWGYDVAGVFPDIGAYMSGDPEHMLNPVSGEIPRKRVKVILPLGVGSSVPSDVAAMYAIASGSIIRSLEAAGLGVAVAAINASRYSGKLYANEILLRGYGDVLDMDRLVFACGHPAFNRRLCFAWQESHAQYAPVTVVSYGYAVKNWPDDRVAAITGDTPGDFVTLPAQATLTGTGKTLTVDAMASAMQTAVREKLGVQY